MLLACFQEARHFSPGTGARFGRLAARAALTGALGVGMAAVPAPGGPRAPLGPGDPLRGEWDVIMVGPISPPPWWPGTVIRAAQPLLDLLLPAT